MKFTYSQPLFSHFAIWFMIGLVAIGLPFALGFTSNWTLPSISDAFCAEGESATHNIFVGALCIVAALLFIYNGYKCWHLIVTKLAACAAIGVAFSPGCQNTVEPTWHNVCALGVFASLVIFCFCFFAPKAKWGWMVWVFCGFGTFLTVLLLAIVVTVQKIPPLPPDSKDIFYLEMALLIVFGLAWIAAAIGTDPTGQSRKFLRRG